MQYASPKLPGRKSMLEKGERFFNSRKVRIQREYGIPVIKTALIASL